MFADLPTGVEVQYYDIDTSNIMLSRSYAQLAFLQAHDFRSHVIFLDTDILINENLDAALNWTEFDIALTLRDDPKGMPINGGVMLISQRSPQTAINFFKNFYQRYVDAFSDEAQWWGDQKALVDVLTQSGQSLLGLGEQTIGDMRLLLLPCATHNYSPDFAQELDMYGAGAGKKVIHFKGARKQYMQPFWESCIVPKFCPPAEQFDRLEQQLISLQAARTELNQAIAQSHRKYLALNHKYSALEKQHQDLRTKHQAIVARPFQFVWNRFKQRFIRRLNAINLPRPFGKLFK